jgi:RNA polymerase sigma factor (TIGR02999 family)
MNVESDADSGRRSESVNRLIRGPDAGSTQRAEELLPLLYDELRALARARLSREAPGQTIQATVLVHEAYLRLVGDRDPGWNGRRHFFGAAALAMRRILVEQARRKARLRHGGGRSREDLDEQAVAVIEAPRSDLVALDEALCRLEAQDPRKGQIVNLRYFAGLSAEHTAEALGLSIGTVEREWRFIKAWLQEQLGTV